MNIKRLSLALAVSAAFTVGVSQEASASVYAGSGLQIQNLLVNVGGASAQTRISSFEFTATNTATLNGASSPTQSATCSGTPGSNNCGPAGARLDAATANAPGSTVSRAANDFTLMGPGTQQYSNSDSIIRQAELTDGLPTNTQQLAESEIQSSGAARANAEITSNTGFVLRFTVSGNGTLAISFEADPYQRAAINQVGFLTGSAQSNLNASFSLTHDNTGDAISWSPQGTLANDCSIVNDNNAFDGATCSETNDSKDLNRNVSVSTNPNDVNNSIAAGFGLFGINIAGLSDGDYTLAFNAVTSTSVRTTTVPEPGMIALLGMGLMGMGFAGRKSAQTGLKA